MNTTKRVFDEHSVLHQLKHYLPAQAPLKDFIHHNTLHAFQHKRFYDALSEASSIFGYRVSLSLHEYRQLYSEGKINKEILSRVIKEKKGAAQVEEWTTKLINTNYKNPESPRIGSLRSNWKRQYQLDMDSMVHPILFRILCSYLDQGISIWNFPVNENGLLASLRVLEQNGFTSFFHKKRAKQLLLAGKTDIKELLRLVVGEDEAYYTSYLYDQQFAHQGWSGMVSAIEDLPESLLNQKAISMRDLVAFELLLEIDALDFHFGESKWQPLSSRVPTVPTDLFAPVAQSDLKEVFTLWQDAFEWTYYDQVLVGMQLKHQPIIPTKDTKNFQALFCIDDRECSIRRHIEQLDSNCETYGTPGFFGVEFFYQPQDGKFYTKLCPATVTPKYLIKEESDSNNRETDIHFSKHAHSFHSGWLISQTLGFWSVIKLALNIFRPTMSPSTASSFKHMNEHAKLTIEYNHQTENNLQVGFTIDEMATRVEGLLRSIGLVDDFAPIVYVVGHGSSSVNNPHYAAYDCGACSGRPGSVNARVISYMANHEKVRLILREKGIHIPPTTQFVGSLHDTTRDEMQFFDEDSLFELNKYIHGRNKETFTKALDANAKERSRRFVSINTHQSPEKVHEEIRIRSVSLFEPRPELNHATNALCVVGSRDLTKDLFLDRRSFLNSYDYRIDPDGKHLYNILKAVAPVCGGINLEYYFSRVDNQKLGAGTKLPHNVMGLFGVANGIDGDLRPGLPSQMIEVHDPIRLLVIVEHQTVVVMKAIQFAPETYEWFKNEWVHLVVVHPITKALSYFKNEEFIPYQTIQNSLPKVNNLLHMVEDEHNNFPVSTFNS
ncbi:hypothetical protein AEM51_06765 [Bacteroidetes bacterium UKL13-3]|jgi:uncharacterized protein YbcC (UPF0753/DUF2309 family)|nr:hypothetical protein AEM51_06765 [Bacteroidetes bacterium UKL13-3]HCP93436.1 DUF2309 domain-containing protein [Bacteroidota bacterium]